MYYILQILYNFILIFFIHKSSNTEQPSPTPTPTPSLQDNAIILDIVNNDINVAQASNDDRGIIHIPSNEWNHIIKEIQKPSQSFYNELYLDVSKVNLVPPPTFDNDIYVDNTLQSGYYTSALDPTDVNKYVKQPVVKSGKYKFYYQETQLFDPQHPNDPIPVLGWLPAYLEDQTTRDYDIKIQPNTPTNKATLSIRDGALNIARTYFNGKITLPSNTFSTITSFDTNGKDYATELEIDVSELTMPQFNNGNGGNIITITENNSRSTFEETDGDRTTIEYITTPENTTPTPLMRSIVAKKGDTRDSTTSNIVGYIDVNIPPPKINSPTTNNGFYKFNNDWNALIQGSTEDHDLIIQVPNSTETLTATQNNHTYTPSQGNVGFRSVTVEVPQPSVESTKTVNITQNTTTIITPSDNYNSIGRLEITTAVPSNVNNQTLTTIKSNGTYTPDSGYSGFNSFTVDVSQPSIQQNKSITLTNNETVTINPDNNYDALGQITITTEVPITDTVINNQNVNNKNLITRNGFYAPDSQHTGFNAFSVAVPIQNNRTVNVNGKIGQTLYVFPDAGYEGLKKTTVNVIAPTYQSKTIKNNGVYFPDSGYDGFSSVTVEVSSVYSLITRLLLPYNDLSISTYDFHNLPSNGTITVPLETHEHPESGEDTKDFWILSYIIRDNKCWLCCSNFYTYDISQQSSVTITNGSSQPILYRICREYPFYDGSAIDLYGMDNGTNYLLFRTLGTIYELSIQPNETTYLYGIYDVIDGVGIGLDPTDPNRNITPTFNLKNFRFLNSAN